MARIHIHPPEGAPALQVEVSMGETVLVGREPDGDAREPATGVPAPTRLLEVASPLVSSQHLAVWYEDGALRARDLGSKNGTFLRLPRGGEATLPGGDEAHLFLAAPAPAPRASVPSEVALDAGAGEFAARTLESVSRWLGELGLRPSLRVATIDPMAAADAPADGAGFVVPLVEGLALAIADEDEGRTQLRWDGIKARLYPWVYDQVARWRTFRAARLRRPLAFGSPVAQRVLGEVLDAARAGVALVLTGESGTGKTELAAIYAGRESLRPGRSGALARSEDAPPFVTAHCAHLDPALAHSLLFGALKGSYTSADRTILGAVKLADGGVLFLDDVDALPLETQAKLLRFLDHGLYEPLGHGQREPLVADVRVVAGTNVDLRQAVHARRFREDLYWRLHTGAVVRVPPLRERRDDVEQLLRDAPGYPTPGARGARDGSAGRPASSPSVCDRLDAGALDHLLHRHAWRGNFRECLRFCARVRMEPPSRPVLDRRRCVEILAEASLDETAAEEPLATSAVPTGGGEPDVFGRSLEQAVAWWTELEGEAPSRFDDLARFCETYLKSIFVASTLGLADAEERPETFDRALRQQLGCDLSTVKRKIDDYLERKRAHRAEGG